MSNDMIIYMLVNTVVSALALGGIFFVIVGAIGMHRMPDVYSRIHAASIIDTGGASLIMASLCVYGIYAGEGMAVIKILLTYFFILFTGPTSSHAVAKMALMGQETPIGKRQQPVVHKDLLETSQRQYTERAKILKHK
ncbi:MAG: monovalent cation/H(+) antiporter subunit G [Arenicella sp.]